MVKDWANKGCGRVITLRAALTFSAITFLAFICHVCMRPVMAFVATRPKSEVAAAGERGGGVEALVSRKWVVG